jgi:hypothetical protein
MSRCSLLTCSSFSLRSQPLIMGAFGKPPSYCHSTLILSRSIRQFEHRIGVTVFERSGGGKASAGWTKRSEDGEVNSGAIDVLVATAKSNGRGKLAPSIGFAPPFPQAICERH